VDEVNIERVKSARILGLTVQDNMKWNEHINNIVKKASKRLYMLRLLTGMPEPRMQRVQVHPLPFAFSTLWVQTMGATGAQNFYNR
jgi:hypothetical protein